MFNLAALGAGLGQFAQDYRQQQAQQERNMMLRIQLANFQREMEKDRADKEAAAMWNLGPMPSTTPIGGGVSPSMPGMPGPQSSASPLMGSVGGMPSMPRGPSLAGPIPSPRPGGGFAPPGFSTPGAQPNFPTRQNPQGQPIAFTNENKTAANTPPDKLSDFGPGSPYGAKPDQMTTPAQAASIAGKVASGLTSPGGTQMAQSGGDQGQPKMPEPPPSAPQIAQWAFSQNPQADPRAVRKFATDTATQLKSEYETKLQEYRAQLEQWEKFGPGRQITRQEKFDDTVRTTAATSQIPPREAPKLLQGPGGQLVEWTPGTPLPDGGVGWHPAGTTANTMGRASRNVEVTDADGKKIFSGLAHQDTMGQWISDKDQKPVNIPDDANFRATPLGEGRQGATAIQRVTNAGNLLSAELRNMTQLPAMSAASIFQGVEAVPGRQLGDAIKRSLAAAVTPSDATDMATTFQGVARAVAALETSGAATGLVGLTEQAKVYQPQSTDNVGNVMRKMATLRQILERSLDSAAAAKDTTPEQKKLFDGIKKEVAESMPYTVEQVTKLQHGDAKTYRELFRETAGEKAAPASGAPGASPAAEAAVPPPPEAIAEVKAHRNDPVYLQSFEKHFGKPALDAALK